MGALVATHHELVKGFVKSLGLDPKKIYSLTITFEVDNIVILETKSFVYEEEIKEMIEMSKKYRLRAEEIEEDDA